MIQPTINPAIEGTLYLKRVYQRNLFVALLIGISLHVAALGTYCFFSEANLSEVTNSGPDIEGVLRELPPPPRFDEPPQIPVKPLPGAIPDIGIPVPVSDEEVTSLRVLPTKNQRIPIDPSGPGTNQNFGVGRIEIEPKEIFPDIDAFIAYDEDPEAIHLEPAVYPTMARRAGISGLVVVRALLDKQGYVRDAVALQVSTENVGFAEAAIAAALKGRWTPAMQNNQPVPCWVSYTVTFDIE